MGSRRPGGGRQSRSAEVTGPDSQQAVPGQTLSAVGLTALELNTPALKSVQRPEGRHKTFSLTILMNKNLDLWNNFPNIA
jgi:hypothetical protein